jgi:hypothetical protein
MVVLTIARPALAAIFNAIGRVVRPVRAARRHIARLLWVAIFLACWLVRIDLIAHAPAATPTILHNQRLRNIRIIGAHPLLG